MKILQWRILNLSSLHSGIIVTMSKIAVSTPKGFRDFLGAEARLRQNLISKFVATFERFGFEPLLTPALEYAEVLKGKYGEEEKLIYEFEDRGGRQVALRYDQTVPLARVVAQYPTLTKPYKRYQIQPVWRAESPQKGRYREFLQVDIDTIGTTSPLSDAEIIACVTATLESLNFDNFTIKINDREIFAGLPNSVISTIDKLPKIGKEGVVALLKNQSYSEFQANDILKKVTESVPTEKINKLFELLEKMGVNNSRYAFDPSLARGLDYYTGLIFEVEVEGYSGGSVGGGGRYDRLIGVFNESSIPAVGFSFGFDRVIEALTEQKKTASYSGTKVLVTIFNEDLLEKSLQATTFLRNSGANTEIYLDTDAKLDKQLKYADNKNIPFALIVGPAEVEKDLVNIKNLKTTEQKQIKIKDVISLIDAASWS